MRKIFPLWILILIFSNCSKDNEETSYWILQDAPTTKSLTDIEFYSDGMGIISGSFGTLLKTTDGGETWQSMDVGVNHSFLEVFILNSNEFHTTRTGIYRTNNGGSHFNELGNFSDEVGSIPGIHFFNSDHGIICKTSSIYRTTNGGNTWTNVYPQFGYADKLQFVNKQVGFLAGGRQFDTINYGELHRTMDAGETWSVIELPDDVGHAKIMSMHFLNEDLGYIANSKHEVFKTTNGGASWTFRSNASEDSFTDMVFLNEHLGYAIGNASVYITKNGGLDWTIDYTNNAMRFAAISNKPNGEIVVIGNDGVIIRKK